ncbi:MAG: hypothetical protein ACRD50_07090 [Candidatus Acidiferrales bacterium]
MTLDARFLRPDAFNREACRSVSQLRNYHTNPDKPDGIEAHVRRKTTG